MKRAIVITLGLSALFGAASLLVEAPPVCRCGSHMLHHARNEAVFVCPRCGDMIDKGKEWK